MTLRELLSHFHNCNLWCDICTPAYRKCGCLGNILRENPEELLKMEVASWKVNEDNILEVNL